MVKHNFEITKVVTISQKVKFSGCNLTSGRETAGKSILNQFIIEQGHSSIAREHDRYQFRDVGHIDFALGITVDVGLGNI